MACLVSLLQVVDLTVTLCCVCQAINTNRRCRDLIYLILFAVFWGGMLYVAYLAFKRGLSASLLVCVALLKTRSSSNVLHLQVDQPGYSMQLIPTATCVGLTTTGMGQAGLTLLLKPSCTI